LLTNVGLYVLSVDDLFGNLFLCLVNVNLESNRLANFSCFVSGVGLYRMDWNRCLQREALKTQC
jgi:hypothetical protein